MSLIYYVAGGLYAAMVFLCVWLIAQDPDVRSGVHFYRVDSVRGGFLTQDDTWAEQKSLRREWSWYGIVVATVLLSPFLMLFTVAWDAGLGRFINKRLPVSVSDYLNTIFGGPRSRDLLDIPAFLRAQPDAPALKHDYSGGDGSSRETAIVVDVDDPKQGMLAEYDYIEHQHGTRVKMWQRDTQMKVSKEGRDYDVISIELRDRSKKVFWFDISRFVGN